MRHGRPAEWRTRRPGRQPRRRQPSLWPDSARFADGNTQSWESAQRPEAGRPDQGRLDYIKMNFRMNLPPAGFFNGTAPAAVPPPPPTATPTANGNGTHDLPRIHATLGPDAVLL